MAARLPGRDEAARASLRGGKNIWFHQNCPRLVWAELDRRFGCRFKAPRNDSRDLRHLAQTTFYSGIRRFEPRPEKKPKKVVVFDFLLG
jgi:hypothetical protein